ncbi:MAG: CBS domain-containing protein [Actinobacteria bacterium]|nr:CBS domain-containing protein [Actinomycetota bacterium]
MNVQEILSAKGSAVATIDPGASLADASASLRDHGIGALIVSANGSTIGGILSERDVVRALAAHGGSTLGRAVSTAMSDDVVTCTPGDTVDQLMAMMTDRRIRHVPVTDESGSLVGIISIGDVVKARLGQLEHENDQLYGYIQGR